MGTPAEVPVPKKVNVRVSFNSSEQANPQLGVDIVGCNDIVKDADYAGGDHNHWPLRMLACLHTHAVALPVTLDNPGRRARL